MAYKLHLLHRPEYTGDGVRDVRVVLVDHCRRQLGWQAFAHQRCKVDKAEQRRNDHAEEEERTMRVHLQFSSTYHGESSDCLGFDVHDAVGFIC